MTYKLVAADLDDTLLRDDLTISQETIDAMHQAVAKGVTVTIATGRSFPSAAKIANQIGLNVPIITYQGALIKNLLDEEVLYERTVPVESARLLLDFCESAIFIYSFTMGISFMQVKITKKLKPTYVFLRRLISLVICANGLTSRSLSCLSSIRRKFATSCAKSCCPCWATSCTLRSPNRTTWNSCIRKVPKDMRSLSLPSISAAP